MTTPVSMAFALVVTRVTPRGARVTRTATHFPRPRRTSVVPKASESSISEKLELTADNVELVLDEVRPYLIADGGDVELVEIDGLVVRLKLNGACGSCPSSTTTMRMGIEKRLLERKTWKPRWMKSDRTSPARGVGSSSSMRLRNRS